MVPADHALPPKAAAYSMRDVNDALAPATAGVAKALLAAGADPNVADSAGFTPLHLATLGGLDEVCDARAVVTCSFGGGHERRDKSMCV